MLLPQSHKHSSTRIARFQTRQQRMNPKINTAANTRYFSRASDRRILTKIKFF